MQELHIRPGLFLETLGGGSVRRLKNYIPKLGEKNPVCKKGFTKIKQDLRKTQIYLYIHTNAVKIHPNTIEREPHIYADILNY